MSVGPGIRPQKGQRDNFTREPPCLQQSILGVPVCMKPSLASVWHKTRHARFLRYVYAYKINWNVNCWYKKKKKRKKKNQHVNFFLVGYCRYRGARTFAHALMECLNKREKRSTSRHRRWSVVPNESSRDFGPCDRFWTQLALRCFLLPTLPPGTALRERYVGP